MSADRADSERALVERLMALEAKATPGAWHPGAILLPKWKVGAVQYRANQELVAEARNALPTLLALASRGISKREGRPKIVCLCGSTRFMEAFFDEGWRLTLAGYIVLSVGVCKHAEDHGGEALGPEVAAMLDELHLRKIDLADEVFVLNVGGYIGESTRREIEYATTHGKPVRYLEGAHVGAAGRK